MGKPIRSARKGRAPGGGLCVLYKTFQGMTQSIKIILALVVAGLVGLYWLQIRPEGIRKECFRQVTTKPATGFSAEYFIYEQSGLFPQTAYDTCLKAHGQM